MNFTLQPPTKRELPSGSEEEGYWNRIQWDNPTGWLAHELAIPEVSYWDLFPENPVSEDLNAAKERIIDAVPLKSAMGIVKVVGLPAPDLEREREKQKEHDSDQSIERALWKCLLTSHAQS